MRDKPKRLLWILVILIIGWAGIEMMAWIGNWSLPTLQSLWHQSDDHRAWNAACDAVRARVKYPIEAVFPEMPDVKEVLYTANLSLMFNGYKFQNSFGNLHKLRGETEEYFKYRQEVLNQVEMAKDQAQENWVISGWTDSPNAMGVRQRLPWYAKVEKSASNGEFNVTEIELVDLNSE